MSSTGERKRKRFKGQGGAAAAASQSARVAVTYINKPLSARLRTERKYFDSHMDAFFLNQSANDWASTSVEPAGGILCLFYPTQGAGVNQRIGNRVQILKIQLRAVISANSQSAQTNIDSSFCARLVLFFDQMNNGGATFNPSLLMQTPPGAPPGTPLVHCAFQDVEQFGRFRVLKDVDLKSMPVTAVNNTTAGSVSQAGQDQVIHWKINFKKYPVLVRFGANSGLLSDIQENALHLVAHCTNSALNPYISWTCRVVYVDA